MRGVRIYDTDQVKTANLGPGFLRHLHRLSLLPCVAWTPSWRR